jgi:short-subunit dehydrogenase
MAIPAPRTGSAAFVTGASSGIGEALAGELASRGHDVVLVARRRDRLEKLAAELREKYGRRAEILVADLGDAADRDRMLGDLDALGLDLEILVLCAGFGMVGPYLEHDAQRVNEMVRTNVEATMALARALAPAMVARRRGAILFVSSMAGNQPMPYFAPYAATKAAVTSLGESLHCELKPSGISVSVLAPGNVSTEFSTVAEAEQHYGKQPAFMTATATQCAEAGLNALEKGKRKVVPLPQTAVFAWVSAHLPLSIWLPVCKKMLT